MEEEIIEEAPREITPIESITGSVLVNNKNEIIDKLNEVFNSKIYCLFFTASWCNPCEILAKELIEIYNEINEGIRNVEIIQINFERDEISYKNNISDKPWVFLPYGDNRGNDLKENLNILYIPVLAIYRHDGSLITENGRKHISEEGISIFDKWLA